MSRSGWTRTRKRTAPRLHRRRTDPTCSGKRRFSDEVEARAAGMVSLREWPGQARLFIYPCPHCHGWHLTKSNNGVSRMVTLDEPVYA